MDAVTAILILLGVYGYSQGWFSALGLGTKFTPATTLYQQLPGGISIGVPIPPGMMVYNLADGSQVVIQPNAATAPGGWVQATHAGATVWFNTQTGQMQ